MLYVGLSDSLGNLYCLNENNEKILNFYKQAYQYITGSIP